MKHLSQCPFAGTDLSFPLLLTSIVLRGLPCVTFLKQGAFGIWKTRLSLPLVQRVSLMVCIIHATNTMHLLHGAPLSASPASSKRSSQLPKYSKDTPFPQGICGEM